MKNNNVYNLNEYRIKKQLNQIIEDIKMISDMKGFNSAEDLDAFLELLQLDYDNSYEEEILSEDMMMKVREIVGECVALIVPDIQYREGISMRELVNIESLTYDELSKKGILSPTTQRYADKILGEYSK